MTLRDEIEDPTRRLEIEVAIAGTFLHAVNPTTPDGVPGILGLSVKKSIDSPVPVASIRVNRIPNWISLGQFGRVAIALGYNGLGATIFDGTVQDRAPGENDAVIHAAGNSFALFRTVQIPPQVFGAITTKAAIEQVVAYATDRNPTLQIPDEPLIRHVDPDSTDYYILHSTAELDRQTSAQMIQTIADIEHWVIWENNAGHIVFKDLHAPGNRVFRVLGTQVAAESWIVGQRSREDPTALRTRLTVLGGTITTGVPPNEVTNTPEKTASITPASLGGIVELPAGSFIDAEYSNSLIHDDDRAADLAVVKLNVLAFIPRQVTMRIPGDPELDIGQTIELDYPEKDLVAPFYIFGIEHKVDNSGYTTILDLRGGEGSGAQVAIIPTAAFTVRIDREVFNDNLYIFATFDASPSFAEDGGVLTYDWSDNQSPEITTPDIESETAEIITVQLLPADISGDWEVSLAVTDSNGLVSDIVPVTVDTSPTGTDVQIPAVFAAIDNRQTATPDGGGNWYDRTDVDVTAVTARPPDGVLSGIAVFGQADGTILKTTDFCRTALVEVKPAAGGSPKIWHMLWDYRNRNLVWAVDEDARLYKSSTGGDTWGLYDDLGSVLGLGSGATLRHIGLPRVGGVWVYGGDGAGNPIIARDRTVDGHSWLSIPLGGELSADLPAASTSFRIVDAEDVGFGLTIACENADAGDSGVRPIYFIVDPFVPANWKRATGLSAAFTDARFVVAASRLPTKFLVGKDDQSIWFTVDGEAYTERTSVFPANVTPHHAIWLPNFVHSLNTANVHLIAVEDSASQLEGIYKSADEMQTIELIRPVSPFSTWPASSIGRQVAVGSPVATGGLEDHLWMIGLGSPNESSDLVGPNWTAPVSIAGLVNDEPRPHYLTDSLRFVTDNDNNDPNATTWGVGRRTKDGGAIWDTPGTPPNFVLGGIFTYAIDAGGRVWCLAHTDDVSFPKLRVCFSDNDGDTWTESTTLGSGVTDETVEGWKIMPHPTDQNRIAVIAFTSGIVSPARRTHVLTTTSRGASWTVNHSTDITQGELFLIWTYDCIMLPSGRLVAMGPFTTADWWHAYSDDDGASWTATEFRTGDISNLTDGFFHSLSFSKIGFLNMDTTPFPGEVRLWLSFDQGATFTEQVLSVEFEDLTNPAPVTGFLFCFAYSPTRDALYFSGKSNTQLAIYRLSPVDATGIWTDVTLDMPFTGEQGVDRLKALS